MSIQNDLEKDLDWRFAELAALRYQVIGVPKGSIAFQGLLRALVALLYAHYEGFCKNTIRLYLNKIQSEGSRRQDCIEQLMVFSLQKTFRQSKSFTTQECWQFYKANLQAILHEIIDYDLDGNGDVALIGESNLYPNLLKENLQGIGLPQLEIDKHELRLRNLVGRRNGIAHGQKLVIHDLATYQEYESSASAVMYEIALNVVESLDNKSYLRLPIQVPAEN